MHGWYTPCMYFPLSSRYLVGVRLLALTAACLASMAAAAAELDSAEKTRLAGLLENKTGMRALTVSTSPFPGLYEMVVGTSVYYMDGDGRWLFDGHVVNLDTKSSVTAQKRLALERPATPTLDWRSLRLSDAIKTVRGKPTPGRVLVTFEDPSCGFCKKLNSELDKLSNVVVYTFPVDILGPGSRARNEIVWCAPDRAAAWSSTLRGESVVAGKQCDLASLGRNSELARTMSVAGTPTLFLADGTRIAGFLDAGALEARLQTQQK